MAAGPEVPQPGALNAPYQYTPVETKLNPPIELHPVDYSMIGNALKGLPEAIMNSGLNPSVRAQIKYQSALYDEGRKNLDKVSQWSPYATTFGATPTIQPPSGQILANVLPQTGSGTAPGSGQVSSGTVPGPVRNAPQTNAPQTSVTANPPADNAGVYSGGPNSVPANVVSPPRPAIPPQTSAGTSPFTNLAKANPPSVDDYAISQVPGQVRATTPGGDVNPQLAASTDDQQLLSQWQDQNAHPVAPASEALKWAKNNFDTRAQDATYMPHGGPMNQPAYAFHMKGGATNMVPLSQMVQNGFAANVAGNNTSMTLSTADQVRKQGQQQMQPTGDVSGQPPPQAPTGQQMQPTGDVSGQPAGQPGQPPAAPGAQPGADQQQPQPDLAGPEAKQYLAARTSVMTPSGETNPVLSADATGKQRAIAEANLNGQDVHYDNPSHAPEPTNGTYDIPALPEEKQNADTYIRTGTPVPNQEVDSSVKQNLGKVNMDYNALPSANVPNAPDLKIASVMPNGVTYFIDPTPGDSHIAFRLYSSPPWEQHRMYNDGKYSTTVVPLPGGAVDKFLYDRGISTTGRTYEQKQSDMANAYWNEMPAYNLDPGEGRTLENLRGDALQSQRLLKLTNVMSPEEYNMVRQAQQGIAGSRNQLKGIPGVGDAWQKIAGGLTEGGKVNQRLSAFNTAFDSLKASEGSDDLTPGERGQLKGLNPQDEQFREKLVSLNSDRMNQYVRYYDQILANHKKGAHEWMDARTQIKNQGELADPQFIDVAGTPGVRGVTPANVRQAAPVVPRDNSRDNPIDLSKLPQADGEAYLRKLRGTKAYVRDADGVVQQMP